MQSSRVDTTDEEEDPKPELRAKGSRGGKRDAAHGRKHARTEGVAAGSAKRARRGNRSETKLSRLDTTDEDGCSNKGALRTSPEASAVLGGGTPGGTQTIPASSSVSDYARWVVECVLTDAERVSVFQLSDAQVLRVGSMCSGMGTEEIVLQSLADAIGLHQHTLRWQSV